MYFNNVWEKYTYGSFSEEAINRDAEMCSAAMEQGNPQVRKCYARVQFYISFTRAFRNG